MSGFNSFTSTHFSDLWLPTVTIGLGLILLLALHWLWSAWRVQRVEKRLARQQAPLATADAMPTALDEHMTPHDGVHGLSDLNAFTAQKHPVALEEKPLALSVYEVLAPRIEHDDRIDPSFYVDDIAAAPQPSEITSAVHDGSDLDETVFFKPHTTLLQNKPRVDSAPLAHPVFHYQARFSWVDIQGKQALAQALQAHPWAYPLPLTWCLDAQNVQDMKDAQDAQDTCSAIAAMQVASRRELAGSDGAAQFKQWCETLANQCGATLAMINNVDWDTFLDQAHTLLIGLDSVIVLKVSVPLVQLDLFTQSLLAARFTQSQEHWFYQEHAHSSAIWLERLWQKGSGQSQAQSDSQQAVFQIIIDIPHLDSLEARKVYMRLRAVARTSAAIMQSAQGVHLSEGMLDRYSRELMMKQDALTHAHIAPGSELAKQVFKPQLSLNQDLGIE